MKRPNFKKHFSRLSLVAIIAAPFVLSCHFFGNYWLVPGITHGPIVLACFLKYILDRIK